jgi:hypothetical protein
MKRATTESLLLRESFVTSSVVVHRDTAVAVGLFREDFMCKAGVEDWDFLIRLSRARPGAAVSGCWTFYRHHPSSAIQSHRDRLLQDAERVLELNHDAAPPSVLARARAIVYYESGVRHLAAMAFPAARRDFIRSRGGAAPLVLRALGLWIVSWGGTPLMSFLRWGRRHLLAFGATHCSMGRGDAGEKTHHKNGAFK